MCQWGSASSSKASSWAKGERTPAPTEDQAKHRQSLACIASIGAAQAFASFNNCRAAIPGNGMMFSGRSFDCLTTWRRRTLFRNARINTLFPPPLAKYRLLRRLIQTGVSSLLIIAPVRMINISNSCLIISHSLNKNSDSQNKCCQYSFGLIICC